MSPKDYEAIGGFSDELRIVRKMGMALTELETAVLARQFRLDERYAILGVKTALENLRAKIAKTRQEAA